MSAVAAITGAVSVGIAAAALTQFARSRLVEPLHPTVMSTGVLAALGVLFGALAGWRLDAWPEAPAFAVVALASALLTATDLAAHEIPHKIMWPSALALVLCLAVAAGIEQRWARFGVALLTGLVIAVVYFAIAWFGKGQFGVGDVSLSLLYGLFLGWLGPPYAVVGAFGAFLVHVPVAIGLLVARRAGRTAELPFGPSLIAASWIAAFAGPALLSALIGH